MSSKSKFVGFVCALCAVVGLATSAANATQVTGKINSVFIYGTNYAIVSAEALPSGRPSCHNSLRVYSYAFDISTTKGKALLSSVQAALLSGKPTSIIGGTTCTNVGNNENIETVQALELRSN